MGVFHPAVGFPAVASGLVNQHVLHAYLDAAVVDHVYCAHIRAWSKLHGAEVDLYFSDQGFWTDATDTPASTYFDARLTQPLVWSRRVQGVRFGGESEFRSGSMEIDFTDRAYEFDGVTYTLRQFLANFKVDGRQITVKVVPSGYSYADGLTLYNATAEDWTSTSGGTIQVILRGSAWRLNVPVQPSTYAGTGGLEGDDGLTGKPKPVCFGQVFNIPANMILAGELLISVHTDVDGNGAPIQAIDKVRVGGVELIRANSGDGAGNFATVALLRAATAGSGGSAIEPGEFATCLAEGYVRLGSTPGAAVTLDVKGHKPSTYLTLPGDILQAVATAYGAEFSTDDLDIGSFATLNAARPYTVGRYIGPDSELTVAALFNEVMASLEGSWGDTALGRLQVNVTRLADPDASSVATIDDADIIEGSFRREPYPSDVRPAVKKITYGYGRNYAPSTQLAAGVSASDKVRLEADYLTAVDTQTLSEFAEAKEIRIDGNLVSSTDVATHLADLLDLYDGSAEFGKFRIPSNKAGNLNLGYQLTVTVSDEGYDGVAAIIIGIDFDAAAEEAELAALFEPAPTASPGDFNSDFNSDFS